jgi:hypothetical protein
MAFVVICPRDQTVCVFDKEENSCRLVAITACKPYGEKAPRNWDAFDGKPLPFYTPACTPLHWNTRDGAVNHIDHLVNLHGLRREDLAVGEWSAADGVKADSASMDSKAAE